MWLFVERHDGGARESAVYFRRYRRRALLVANGRMARRPAIAVLLIANWDGFVEAYQLASESNTMRAITSFVLGQGDECVEFVQPVLRN